MTSVRAALTAARTALVATALAAGGAVVGVVMMRVVRPALLAGVDELRAAGSLSTAQLDVLVVAACAGALGLSLAWVGAAMALTVVQVALTAAGHHAAATVACLVSATTPRALRRVVALACGVALTTPAWASPAAATATSAEPAEAGPPRAAPAASLTGLAVPERVTGSVLDETRRTRPSTAPTHVVVRAGDSLWTITAELLGSAAQDPGRSDTHRQPSPGDAPTAKQVARGWRALYRANAHGVGPDPDLIHPGDVLRVPAQHVDRKDES
jgi:hypothetical protein